MRLAVKFAYAGAVLMLTGCSLFSSDKQHNPPAPLVDFKSTLAIKTAWTASIGKTGEYNFSPAVAGDSIYVASSDGYIARLDAASGKQQWRVSADMNLIAGVGTDGDTIAVAGEKGAVLAYDNEGKLRWKVQASSEVLSIPAVGNGVVIVRSVDDKVVAYDATTGDKRWTVTRTLPILTLRNAPGIAMDGPNAYVALPGGHLLALLAKNGAARWEVAVGEPRGATDLERVADVSGTPVVAGSDICAVTFQGRIGCFDTANGNPRWTKTMSSTAGVSVDERFVFASDEHAIVSAFARDTGSSAWSNKSLENRGLSTPISFGRAVAVGDYQGYVHFLSREDGSMLARMSTDGSAIHATPVIAGANVVFQTQSGEVVAYTTE